jgi:hypothetical protein
VLICPERSRLLADYQSSVDQYSKRVHELVEVIATGLGDDLHLVRRKLRSAFEATEKARMALYRHEADHFCDRLDFCSAPTGLPKS